MREGFGCLMSPTFSIREIAGRYLRVWTTLSGEGHKRGGNGTFPKRKGDDAANVYKLFVVVPIATKSGIVVALIWSYLCKFNFGDIFILIAGLCEKDQQH